MVHHFTYGLTKYSSSPQPPTQTYVSSIWLSPLISSMEKQAVEFHWAGDHHWHSDKIATVRFGYSLISAIPRTYSVAFLFRLVQRTTEHLYAPCWLHGISLTKVYDLHSHITLSDLPIIILAKSAALVSSIFFKAALTADSTARVHETLCHLSCCANPIFMEARNDMINVRPCLSLNQRES